MLTGHLVTAVSVFAAIFGMILAIGHMIARKQSGDTTKTLSRLKQLSFAERDNSFKPSSIARLAALVMPMLESWTSILSRRQGSNTKVSLLSAGYFQPNAPQLFTGARIAAAFAFALIAGAISYWLTTRSLKIIGLWTLCGCGLGFIVPGLWLGSQIRKRRASLAAALPDALDMLVLCLEGGVRFNAAMLRMTDEIQIVHPDLAMELNIVQREMQLGLSAGEALKKFAGRCGLSDVRDLAIVVLQSERYGASIAKALRNYSESARIARQQDAEEQAQKASVKILFPTLLCIFPAIFIVILGPAAFQTAKMFTR